MHSRSEHDFDYCPSDPSARPYPLLHTMCVSGTVAAFVAVVASGDMLIGFSILVAFLCMGVLWTRGGVPIFVFCVLYQWLFIVTGYFYLRAFGEYPGMRIIGEIERAITYSLIGLTVVTFGIRATLGRNPYTFVYQGNYDAVRLFWLVALFFSINWFVEISAVQLRLAAFNVAQLLNNVLVFRYLFLYLLLLTIVQQKRHYMLGVIAFVYVLIPELASSMTRFKELFFLFFLVLLSQWRPSSNNPSDRRRNVIILGVAAFLGVFLIVVGLVWSAGLKHSWRTALLTGQVSGSPVEKVDAYRQHALDSIRHFEPSRGAETFASRLSSGVAYFSHVLRVVPRATPHENGALTWRAIRHVLMPRFLFPEKPDLGGDSWLVQKYARLNVAGAESKTSIGLTYMAEFYIDFGFPWMLVPLFVYGLFLGGLFRGLQRVSPSSELLAAVTAGLYLQHFLSYEGNFTKLFGGILQNFLVMLVLLLLAGRFIHEHVRLGSAMSKSGSRHCAPPDAARVSYD